MLNKLLIIFILLISNTTALLADNIYLSAELNYTPHKAIGIVFNEQETKYYHNAKVNHVQLNNYQVEFEIPASSNKDYASAIIMSSEGDMTFATVQRLGSRSINLLNLPICREKVAGDFTANASALKELVKIREENKNQKKQLLRKILTPITILKLNKLERSLGFNYPVPIHAEMNPAELAIRMNSILSGIK